MDRHTNRRERTGIIQIVMIGSVLAAALLGGLHLLGSTRKAWDARNDRRFQQAETIRTAANAEREALLETIRRNRAEAMQRRTLEEAKQLRDGRLRCINGQLFRRLPT
jgi:membrane protein involved in colicin uptake